MQFVQICPQLPENGVCPVALQWVVLNAHAGITMGEFIEIAPKILLMMFTAWGLNYIIKRAMYTLKP